MSKIEINEYVRTKDGEIGIFKGYNNNKKSQWSCKVKLPRMKFWKYYTEEYIVKYSKQYYRKRFKRNKRTFAKS